MSSWLVTASVVVLANLIRAMKLRNQIRFFRVTEMQQLEAIQSLRSMSASGESGGLHAYEKGLLYRILSRSRHVCFREMEVLLKLPDPYQHIDRLPGIRGRMRIPDSGQTQDEPTFRFFGRYRSERYRMAAKGIVTVLYFIFAVLAIGPLAFASYANLNLGDLRELRLLVVCVILFGYGAWCCLFWLDRTRSAENLDQALRKSKAED